MEKMCREELNKKKLLIMIKVCDDHEWPSQLAENATPNAVNGL